MVTTQDNDGLREASHRIERQFQRGAPLEVEQCLASSHPRGCAGGENNRRDRSRLDHANTLSSVIGKSRTRFPVAWKTALAIAAAVPTSPISPIPFTPIGFTIESFSSTKIISMSCTSAFTGTW